MFHFIPKIAIAMTLLLTSLSAQMPSHPVRLLAYGKTCGPKLTAKAWFDEAKVPRLTFKLESRRKATIGVWFIGVQKTQLQIPGTSCGLYTAPVLVYYLVTDNKGGTSFTTVVPKQLKKSVFMQMALFPFDSLRFGLETSNGMQIQVK